MTEARCTPGPASIVWPDAAGCGVCESGRLSELVRRTGDWTQGLVRGLIVCGICGNKRCPRASWHGYKCTGSNEPGQKGVEV